METATIFVFCLLASSTVLSEPQAQTIPSRTDGTLGDIFGNAQINNEGALTPGTVPAQGNTQTGTQTGTQIGAQPGTQIGVASNGQTVPGPTNSAQGDAQTGVLGSAQAGTQGGTQAATSGSATGGATGGGSSSTASSGEDELDESLADYMLKLLKSFQGNNTGKNASQPANATSQAQKVPAQNNTASVSENKDPESTTPISLPMLEGMDTSDTDEYYDYDSAPDWIEDEEYTTPEPFSVNGKANCNAEVDLTNYCIFDGLVEDYFDYDFSPKGLAAPIFDMEIVNRLKSECKRGEWCLGDYLPTLMERASSFYRGPYMEEDMWGCLMDVLEEREGCDDKHYAFVVDAADFLYNVFNEGDPETYKERLCFGHALAALHVTYADFLAKNMSTSDDTMATLCDGEGYRMAKTYLCADDACESFFEAREAMERFSRWQWFMDNVNDVIQNCNLDNQCGKLGQGEDENKVPDTWFGMSTSSPESTTEFWYDWDTNDEGSHHAFSAPSSEGDENMMVALLVASAVGVLFMVIGLIFWRRNRRRSNYYYRENGYGKLLESDEVGLLRGGLDD